MRIPAVIVLTFAASLSMAQYHPTGIRWPGWEVTSSEDLFAGRLYTYFPLTHLFDGNPRTAWIESASPKRPEGYEPPRDAYAITIKPDRAMSFDGIRIMNGYNESASRFRDNRRVVKVSIFDATDMHGRHPLKVANLKDRMGWHTIRIPRRKYPRGIRIVLDKFAGSIYQDIALSEIQLIYRSKPLSMGLPKAVLATDGSNIGRSIVWSAMDRKGKVMARSNWGETDASSMAPQGRFAAGIQRRSAQEGRLWVLDMRTGLMVRSEPIQATEDLKTTWEGRKLSVRTLSGILVRAFQL